MQKKERVKIKREAKKFAIQFYKGIKRQVALFEKLNLNVIEIFPKIFYSEGISFEVVYSINKENILIRMISSDSFKYDFYTVNGDVIDYYDKSGVWSKQKNAAILIDNCTNVTFKNCSIEGSKPFSLSGKAFLNFEGTNFTLPNAEIVTFEYGYIMSYDLFLDKLDNIDEYIDNVILTYYEYYKQYNERLNLSEVNNLNDHKHRLSFIKENFSKLIKDPNTKELVIDNFIAQNPIILEIGLDIIKPMHQVILKDIHSEYGQDLKPDVIGFNKFTESWNIIDYKRAKRSLVKNVGQVRTSFKAEVNDLEAQLLDYKDYFNDSAKREHIKIQYNEFINNPEAIGIIGYTEPSETSEFNRLILQKPKWLTLRTYNYLERKLEDHIQHLMTYN